MWLSSLGQTGRHEDFFSVVAMSILDASVCIEHMMAADSHISLYWYGNCCILSLLSIVLIYF
jgi:hypothetical protein